MTRHTIILQAESIPHLNELINKTFNEYHPTQYGTLLISGPDLCQTNKGEIYRALLTRWNKLEVGREYWPA